MNDHMRLIWGFILILAASQLCTMSHAARAQDFLYPKKESKGPSAEEVYKHLPPDEQVRLNKEATDVFNFCNSRDMFASFHDCRCVSSEFWKERVLNYDPLADPISVADNVASKCPNEPGAAGYAYTHCTRQYENAMKFGVEDFCTCYANTFAKLYMGDPRAFMPNITNIASQSTLICTEKGLPSPMAGAPNPAY